MGGESESAARARKPQKTFDNETLNVWIKGKEILAKEWTDGIDSELVREECRKFENYISDPEDSKYEENETLAEKLRTLYSRTNKIELTDVDLKSESAVLNEGTFRTVGRQLKFLKFLRSKMFRTFQSLYDELKKDKKRIYRLFDPTDSPFFVFEAHFKEIKMELSAKVKYRLNTECAFCLFGSALSHIPKDLCSWFGNTIIPAAYLANHWGLSRLVWHGATVAQVASVGVYAATIAVDVTELAVRWKQHSVRNKTLRIIGVGMSASMIVVTFTGGLGLPVLIGLGVGASLYRLAVIVFSEPLKEKKEAMMVKAELLSYGLMMIGMTEENLNENVYKKDIDDNFLEQVADKFTRAMKKLKADSDEYKACGLAYATVIQYFKKRKTQWGAQRLFNYLLDWETTYIHRTFKRHAREIAQAMTRPEKEECKKRILRSLLAPNQGAIAREIEKLACEEEKRRCLLVDCISKAVSAGEA